MKKIIFLIFPLLLVGCGRIDTPETQETTPTVPTTISSEAEKTPEKNTTATKPHKAQLSTAKPETKEVANELDAVFEEIAGGK